MAIKVAVLRGGISNGYEDSLDSGLNVLRNLRLPFEGVDILIDRDGVWHRNGIPEEPHQLINHVDVVWNALHGEAAQLISEVDKHQVPFTASGAFAQALSLNKTHARALTRRTGILVPESILSTSENILGKRVKIGILENFRGAKFYLLIPAVLRDDNYDFKHSLSQVEKEIIYNITLTVHRILQPRHYAEHDFVIKKNGTPYYLGSDTHPKLSQKSFFPTALREVGCSMPEFLKHTLNLALSRG